MKLGNKRRVFLIFLAALMIAIFFGFITAKGRLVYAEESTAEELSGSYYSNFVYSAKFDPAAGAVRAGFVFGEGEDVCWIAAAETAKDSIALYKKDEQENELKRVAFDFAEGEQLKMTLVVNDGVAKIFIGSDNVAALTCKIEGYEGGKIATLGDGFEISNVQFTETDTPDGDIYIGGYEVLKVVNLNDSNYVLDAEKDEYSVSGGVLKVSGGYLKTLEADSDYLFRVVTAFTDFNFKVSTDFTSVKATPSIEKYYKNNDVTLELSANVKVHKLLLDGKACEFTQTEDRVVISSEQISSLSIGKHSVKLFTDKGRPEATINIAEKVETITEPEVKSAHVWLWIDITIFALAIIGYITFTIISKKKKK